jgi:hypothetical protein
MKDYQEVDRSCTLISQFGRIALKCATVMFLVPMIWLPGVQKAAGAPRAVRTGIARLPKGPAVCITDTRSGDSIQFTNPGGAYIFTHCATGLTITGTGKVSTPSGSIILTDTKSTQKVSATYFPNQQTGHAAIYYQTSPGIFETFTINQSFPTTECGCGTPVICN